MTNASRFSVDAAFPGGNIIVEEVREDRALLRQDLRDTEGHWFYWCFRVRGAAGREVRFEFTAGNVIGVRGPAISRDAGRTWSWLGRECVEEASFRYSFSSQEQDVRFSMGMPYQEANLNDFLSRFEDDSRLRVEELCRTRAGRNVERLHFGCLEREPVSRVLLTCRHHCCEMMANYELEGIIEETLSDSPAGAWLAANVEFMAVPFVDKDGVEAGDQGKNRRPHDHNHDYHEDGIYPTIRAIREFVPGWSRNELLFGLDMHCPGLRREFHEVILFPGRLRDAGNWERAVPFLETLEQVQQGPLQFSLADSQRFTTWDGRPPKPAPPGRGPRTFSSWVRTLPGVKVGAVVELPYANAAGGEVNQDSARAFGRDLARALHVYAREQHEATRR